MAELLIPLAVGVATQALLSLFTPQQQVTGPRLNDLNSPKSSYGASIPRIYGSGRVTGNLVWAKSIKEVKSKKKRGGKGLGGGQTQTTYSYYGSFAVLLCEGPVTIGKVWLNGKLAKNSGKNSISKYLRVYTGTAGQGIDSLISADKGADAVAYRHRAYLVFQDLPLEPYGNQFPTVSAEVSSGAWTVKEILEDLCLETGLNPADIDATELTDSVSGFTLSQPIAYREAIAELQKAYFFDCVESGGVLKFQKAERPTVSAVLSTDDLASYDLTQSRPPTFEETREEDLELPTEVSLTYTDPALNFAQGVQYARRVTGADSEGNNQESITLPLTLTNTEARAIAEKLLGFVWTRRRKYRFTLSPRWLKLDPGDVIDVPFHGSYDRVQVTRATVGANLLVEVEAQLYQPGVYGTISTPPPSEILPDYPLFPPAEDLPEETPTDGTITTPGEIDLRVIDCPLILDSDEDLGLYLCPGGENWRGGTVYVSRNGGTSYTYAATVIGDATIGSCDTTLGTVTDTTVIDAVNTLTVTITHGEEIETVTPEDLTAGENTALVGSEVIRFQTATLIAPNQYQLSNLWRGRRGTEWAVGSHGAGEAFYLLSDYSERLKGVAEDVGKTLYFKAVTGDQTLDDVDPVTLTVAGVSLKPYAPVSLSATKDLAGNITLSWTRRDRKAGDRTDYANFPLSEVAEKYEIDVRSGEATVRTLTATSPSVVYSAAHQTADFGGVQTSLTVRVYQISALVGRGTKAEATLTPALSHSTPTITGFSPTQGLPGATVTVYGAGLTGATAAAINGTAGTGVTVVSDSALTFTIGSGGTSGLITVTTPGGTAQSALGFTILETPAATDYELIRFFL